MINLLKRKRTRVTEKFLITVNDEELREMINSFMFKINGHKIPQDADIYIQVPGGADWSNTSLELSEHPVQIEWTVESGDDEVDL